MMIKLSLKKGRQIVCMKPDCYLIWMDEFPLTVQSIRLYTFTFENEIKMHVEFLVGNFQVASFSISKDEFINIHTVFNPPTDDKMNVLEEVEGKTADTDQVPAAGTNNALV